MMPNFELTDVEEMPYLYQERSCAMDPQQISAAMGEVFCSVMGFLQKHGIQPASPPLSVYYGYDPETLTFRAGFPVSKDDAAKAEGEIKAAATPAGKALTFTHVGPYAKLRESYGEAMKYIEDNNLKMSAPAWEIYIDDPGTTPEAQLRTNIFMSLAS